MEWTEISKLNYSQNVYVVDNIDQLRAASAARTDTSTIFKLLDENALRLKNRGDMTIASLNLDKLMKEEKYVKTNQKNLPFSIIVLQNWCLLLLQTSPL